MTKQVLIITGNVIDARALENVLAAARDGPFRIEWVTLLSEALEQLSRGGIDVILVDLLLADSQGIDTFDRLFVAAPHTPIMILSDLDDELLAWEAVQRGCTRQSFKRLPWKLSGTAIPAADNPTQGG